MRIVSKSHCQETLVLFYSKMSNNVSGREGYLPLKANKDTRVSLQQLLLPFTGFDMFHKCWRRNLHVASVHLWRMFERRCRGLVLLPSSTSSSLSLLLILFFPGHGVIFPHLKTDTLSVFAGAEPACHQKRHQEMTSGQLRRPFCPGCHTRAQPAAVMITDMGIQSVEMTSQAPCGDQVQCSVAVTSFVKL